MPLTRTPVLFLLALASCQSIAPPPRGTPRLLIEQQGARITATGVDFGAVRLGEPVTTTLFVENTGAGPLQLERFERVGVSSGVKLGEEVLDMPVFVVPQTRALIAAGETLGLPITLLAERPGKERAQLRLWFSSSTIAEPVPFELEARVIDPTCEVQALRDFGGVAVGDSLELPLTLKNPNPTTTTVTLGPLETGSAYDLRGASPTISLASMETRVVTIRFSPRSEGVFREALPVKLSEFCDPVNVKLDGLGVPETLTWGPDADFGFLMPGRAKERTVTVTNFSLLPVQLSRLQLTGGRFFEFVRPGLTSFTVPAAQRDPNGGLVAGTATIDLRFRPTVLGPQTSELSASTSIARPAQLTLPVTGLGGGPKIFVAPLDLGRVSFVAGGPPFSSTLTVRNIGTNTASVDPAYNLQLATSWTIRPANPQSLPDELCVGTFAGGTCSNTIPAGLPSSLSPRTPLPLPLRLALQNANTDSTGVKAWDVTFTSNDPDDPMFTVRISARPVQLPPCNFTLTPALDFGHISEPLPKERALRLCNTGVAPADRCLVSSVALQGNDFSLTEPVRDVELAPQECRTIVVRAEQQGPVPPTPTVRTSSVEVQLSSLQGRATVPLTATQAVGCLVIDPSPMDFGTVAMGCRSVDRTVQLFNQCNTPITITAGALVDDGRQAFSVVTPLPSGPLTLTRSGLPVSMQLRFRPQREGVELGAFRLSVQQPEALEHLVILRGRGAPTTRVTESIAVGPAPSADLLLVVDTSGSFAPTHAFLANELATLHGILVRGGVSLGLAATNSDVPPVDCPRCLAGTLLASDAGVRVITSTTGTPAVHMASWFQGQTGALEDLTANAVNAFTAPNVFDPTRSGGLLRPGSALGVIALTGSEGFGPTPAGFQLALLRNVKGANRPQDFSLSLISDPARCPPTRVSTDPTVLAFDGVDVSLCSSTWQNALEQTVSRAVGRRERFWLSGTPAPTPNFAISWMGSPLLNSDFSFDPITNTVRAPTYTTQAATLSVSYDAVCLP